MITAITIENFKGISEPVRLELRPITLLFGQNSAGKSSLLHALIYAREVFERHNLDADRTLTAGDGLDLGGFLALVHDHDRSRVIRLRFDLDLRATDLPVRTDLTIRGVTPASLQVYLDYVSNHAKSAFVEIAIAWPENATHPVVCEYVVGINGERIGCLEFEFDKYAALRDINHQHPLLRAYCDDGGGPSFFQTYREESGGRLMTIERRDEMILNQPDALPRFDSILLPIEEPDEEDYWEAESALGFTQMMAEQELRKLRKEQQEAAAVNAIRILLDLLFVGPGLILRDLLRQFRYLGPARVVPSRSYAPPRHLDPSRWATGLAGWDLLHASPALVEKVSRLLSDAQRMNLGYVLDLVSFRELEANSPLLAAIRTDRLGDLESPHAYLKHAKTVTRLLFRPLTSPGVYLEPADLGVGVGQMVPVIAAALDQQPLGPATLPAQLVAVEHPELNLHPRLQAELADVFLEGALAEATKGRIFFIETHSDVFTLRLCRRVRESHRRQSGPPPGDGRGDGSGAGYGDGTGDGRGDGSGAGYGDGSGDGGESVLRVKPTDVAVWYVDRSSGLVSVKQILVDVEGEFVQPWPESDSLFEQDFREKYS